MKKIALTGNNGRGKYALVDDEDYDKLSIHYWNILKKGRTFYARRNIYFDVGNNTKKSKTVYIHMEILDIPEGMQVDHIDGNGLNNQKKNLRICTKQQNAYNRKRYSNNTSGYKGVTWDTKTGKWVAKIGISNREMTIGRYDKLKDAIFAYNEAAKKNFGEFAKLNKF